MSDIPDGTNKEIAAMAVALELVKRFQFPNFDQATQEFLTAYEKVYKKSIELEQGYGTSSRKFSPSP